MYPFNLLALALFKIVCLTTCHTSKNVCYGELGCFSNDYPYYDRVLRPIDTLPEPPEEINTKFWLYSHINQEIPQELDPKRKLSIRYSTLSNKLRVKIIIHGFVEDVQQTNGLIQNLIKRSLKSGPTNVIVVDWTDGAYDYPKAVANARVVGAQVAQLITTLKRLVSTPPSIIELIGFNVGAHVAGYAGQRLNGTIGTISGLSPAQLYFDGLPDEVKLDSTDAQIVKIIETQKLNIVPRLG